MDRKRKNVVVLGASGSVGSSALAVLREAKDQFRITGMSGFRRMKELAALCREFDVPCAVAADPAFYSELKTLLPERKTLFIFCRRVYPFQAFCGIVDSYIPKEGFLCVSYCLPRWAWAARR